MFFFFFFNGDYSQFCDLTLQFVIFYNFFFFNKLKYTNGMYIYTVTLGAVCIGNFSQTILVVDIRVVSYSAPSIVKGYRECVANNDETRREKEGKTRLRSS